MIDVFIGFDPREAIAYHVCCQSILEHTKEDIAFHPVRGERRDGSNDFTYGRFEIPHRMSFRGRAIWLDGDMIVRSDIAELAAMDLSYVGARVVQHDYKTKFPVKYLGAKNEDYPRKNWSSVILWNCGFFPNRRLTPDFVSRSSGSFLHRFSWLSDQQIGALPSQWNRLVLEQDIKPDDKVLHYTIGTPCFPEYTHKAGGSEWTKYYAKANAPCLNFQTI